MTHLYSLFGCFLFKFNNALTFSLIIYLYQIEKNT